MESGARDSGQSMSLNYYTTQGGVGSACMNSPGHRAGDGHRPKNDLRKSSFVYARHRPSLVSNVKRNEAV